VVATPVAAPTTTGGAGHGDVHSLSSVFSGLSDPKNSYSISGDQRSGGSFPSWQSQNWTSLGGFGGGNRLGDTPQIDPKKPDEAAKVKNATMGAPSIGNVDLSKIKPVSSNNGGDGFYHDSRFGTFSQTKGPNATYNKDGKAVDLYSGSAVAGVSEQVGVRGTAKTTGQYGTASASGDAFALAEAGAEAKGSIGSNGIQGAANTSARAGIGVKGDADLTSSELKLDGVDPLVAKLGAHADGFAGARVGAGVKAGIGPNFTGVEGKIGGFAGAEGNIDAHGTLGPLSGKIGASGYAGIGAEASGGISLEDWKLHVGGKVGAAFGLGGAVSIDGTLDLKQTAQLGLAAAKQLTPANQAKLIAGGLTGGADLAKSGWGGLKNFLDPEHTNHFSLHGLGVRAGMIGDSIGNGLHNAKDWAGDKLHAAKDWAGDKLHAAKDWAGDKLHDASEAAKFAIAHPGQALHNAKDWAGGKIHDAGQALHNAKDWAGNKLHDAKDWAGDKLHSAGQALHNAKDWAGDKLHDAKDWAGSKLHAAKDWAGDKLHDAGEAAKYAVTHPGETLHNAKDWAGDKLAAAGRGLSSAKDTVVSGASTVYNGVKNNFKEAGSTLAKGASSAWSSVKSTGSDIKHFFGF
jgi:ElaB/YqjD/DUF883 family membrane-anchored ribosome-binding protein